MKSVLECRDFLEYNWKLFNSGYLTMVQGMSGMWVISKEHNDQKWNASNLQNLVYQTRRYGLRYPHHHEQSWSSRMIKARQMTSCQLPLMSWWITSPNIIWFEMNSGGGSWSISRSGQGEHRDFDVLHRRHSVWCILHYSQVHIRALPLSIAFEGW